MILQFRDADLAVLQRMEACLLEIVAAHQKRGPCAIECTNLSRTLPAPMEERLLDALDEAAEKNAAGGHMRMPSGAGHDAQMMQRICPTAMIFVPSVAGLSHNVKEHTEAADLLAGAQLLLNLMVELASED